MSKRLAIKMAIGGLVTALALASADRPASAKDVIRCQAKGQPDVIMTLDGERKFGRVLSCIKGDFVADMTPCAPNGGYGLSYPTGSASLAKVVDRWQDYADHLGGITGYAADVSSLRFDGGFYSPNQRKRGAWGSHWAFKVDRLTGKATLMQEGKPDIGYACAKARPRF
ncbi:hypothetical protein [Methylobacterium sp. SyP6R]|uniref:hypothetical protein n=1 Tax=Methylobacterium sp. SyP6R TaxID=2718876 RepID=UPI001F24B1C2|nr:hypothetical protein [Methylobacterium sp. SyP6R]MCF4130271.1 hypothetical protein [Methylobacterium sp. SyP6R]